MRFLVIDKYVNFMYFIFQLMEENLFRLLIMFYGTFSFSSNIETMYLHLSNTLYSGYIILSTWLVWLKSSELTFIVMGIIYLHACEKALSLLVEDMVVCMALHPQGCCLRGHLKHLGYECGQLHVHDCSRSPSWNLNMSFFILVNYNFLPNDFIPS